MPVEPAHTPNAPPIAGAYSPAVRAGDWLVLAGQVGFDVSTGSLAGGGTAGEARQAFVNVTTVLHDCGATWGDVAKVTIFLADMADFPAVNEIYGEFVEKSRPARTTVQVAALPIGARIEVEAWAYKPA